MEANRPIWIRGPQLRQRWAGMANSTFYDRLKRGLIPAPHYPFGPGTPYWRLDEIEAAEARVAAQTELRVTGGAGMPAAVPSAGNRKVAPSGPPAPKRRGRPRKVQPTGGRGDGMNPGIAGRAHTTGAR